MTLREQLQQTLSTSYTLERELGGGGMSRVFLATETALGRKVVVKVLSPELTAGVNLDRFKREIQVAANLQHPHIVPVLTTGQTDGLPYYTMPFVEGESVRARLTRGPLTITESVSILRDLARALAYAHERGVVHRDIKPDNVLVSGGSATVTDFGIAKAISASRTLAPGATLTQVGTSLGTPAYMAPEQAAADPSTDHRADIYAFGCMAYELLAGRPPFVEKTPQRLLAAHMGEPPQPIGALRPDAPPALSDLVMRCLAKDAAARPQSASDLVRVLESVSSSDSHGAMPSALLATPGTLRRALGIYAAAVVIVAIVAKAAIVGIGLPDWVFPGSLVIMGLGLPVILFTAYVHHTARRALTATPTLTPGGSPAPQGTMATIALKASPHVSWRRTSLGGVYAFAGFVALVGTFMLLRAFGVGPVGSLLAAGKFSSREPVIIADFEVTNTDSALGAVVSDAVRAGLSQSTVISLVPVTRVASTLRLMQQSPIAPLSVRLAREVAQRQGVKAVIAGNVTGVSGGYIVALRLVSADSGLELASFRETGDGPRGLIDAADKLARELRGKIGESLRSVHDTPPLAEVTTSSLEALRKYSASTRANNIEGNAEKAVLLGREAVALDSTFASAWRALSIALGNLGAARSSRDSAMEHAYRFSDHLPEHERMRTVAAYYMSGPHADRTKAIAAYQALVQKYDGELANNIGSMLVSRRDYAGAESIYVRDIRQDSGSGISWSNLIEAQIDQGKLKQAEATLAEARRRVPDNSTIRLRAPMLLYAEGRLDAAERDIDTVGAGWDAGARADLAWYKSGFAALRGRLTEAVRLRRESSIAMTGQGAPIPAVVDSLDLLWADAWFHGSSPAITERIDKSLAAYPMQRLAAADRPYFRAAQAYAIAGRPEKGRAILAEYQRNITDTARLRLQAPAYHHALAEVALAEHKPLVALAEFRRSDVASDGYAAGECAPCAAFDLARAFDQADQPDSAIAMYERYLATPFWDKLGTIDAIALAGTHKRLGELYEARSDRQKAIAHYSQFVDLWKNADPDLQPRVAEVKRRIVRLSEAERP
ncbi:MAG TPA: protein kinase [Gemmatimonadaceae bacterium]|jgi:eukaryotic-like serine/threonine-protein kinase|nr:protein kinase [Gemmatimonadaceae bacterium]